MRKESIILNGRCVNYQLNQTRRNKRLRMSISPEKGLWVSSPLGMSLSVIESFLQEKQNWILKHLAECEQVKKRTSKERTVLPVQMKFPCIDEVWQINYSSDVDVHGCQLTPDFDSQSILISGDYGTELAQELLRKWLIRRAKGVLPKMLFDCAEMMQYQYNRVTIRNQKTRWGSCSTLGNINLNCKLLFLNERQVRYVLIHELCHLEEANHSRRFWALVERYEPEHRNIRQQMKNLEGIVPVWAHA